MSYYSSSSSLSSSDHRADHSEVPHTFYQIDYVSANCGKIVPISKRRIRFKFGYTNMQAMHEGLAGQDCRGVEHEISIMWSLSSGKQSITYDGELIYWNVCDMGDGKMTHSWHDKDGHYIKVIVHSFNSSMKAIQHDDWRQYDLLIDGISYFRAPKIYQIGVFAKTDNASKLPDFVVSTEEKRGQTIKTAEPKPAVVTDLLSFDFGEIPSVTPTPPVQTITPHASPQEDAAILLPIW